MEDVLGRLVNPVVVTTIILAGIAYGWIFLWALHVRPNLTLWLTAVVPGTVFVLVVWSIRGLQGTLSFVYLALVIDWLIFANVGYAAVIVRRRWKARA